MKQKTEPKKRGKLKTNTFYHYAEQYRKHITEEEEIEKIDFTETFWTELLTIIDEGELINININAPPTSGKSLTMMAIANEIMKAKFGRKLKITDIDRDQQEFSRKMRDPNIKNTFRVIDEWNELETTGENSSVEQALYNYFSDVMAQRFVHKGSCSPSDNPDKNALIYLEVISSDKINKINHCKVFYKIYSAGMEIKQLLGIVQIDVKEILQEKWYEEYRRRKFEKMDLILKEGIFRPKILEYAKMILKVVEKLRKLTRMGSILNANIIRNYIKIECRQQKIPQSIVGEELATREVSGILDLWKSYHKINKQILAIDTKIEKTKQEQQEEKELLKIQKEDLNEMRTEIINAITLQETELQRYAQIHKKYNTILTGTKE